MKRLALTLAFVLIAAACTAVVPIQPVAVKGTAMLPALKEGDRIIIERNPQFLERGDIVVFYFPIDPKFSYIKRIIGLPNEVIEIREGTVFVNGTLLNEPYVEPRLNLARRSSEPVKLAADSFYVVGDNRDKLERFPHLGTTEARVHLREVHEKVLLGRVVTRALRV